MMIVGTVAGSGVLARQLLSLVSLSAPSPFDTDNSDIFDARTSEPPCSAVRALAPSLPTAPVRTVLIVEAGCVLIVPAEAPDSVRLCDMSPTRI